MQCLGECSNTLVIVMLWDIMLLCSEYYRCVKPLIIMVCKSPTCASDYNMMLAVERYAD